MLGVIAEIMPLFFVRWITKRYCERVEYRYEGKEIRVFAIARPDVLIKVKDDK